MKKSSLFWRKTVRKSTVGATLLFVFVFFALAVGGGVGAAFESCAFAQSAPTNAESATLNVEKKAVSPFSWTKNFTQLILPEQSGKAASENVDNIASRKPSRPLPIPGNVGVVLRTPSLRELTGGVSTFFNRTSGVEFDALSALRLTPFRAALSTLRLDDPAGIFVFCETAPPTLVLVLPVDDFSAFVDALGGNAAKSDSLGRVKITTPVDALARPFGAGFVAVSLPENADSAAKFLDANVPPRTTGLPFGLKKPILTLEATPRGVALLTDENRPFWRELAPYLMEKIGDNPNVPIAQNLDALRVRLAAELSEARIDLSIDDFATYWSTQTAPRLDSAASRRFQASPPASPVDFNADRFFYILPDAEAPISGQAELAPPLVADLPAPFNRLRRVEYSLNLPRVGELAAESWLFYLEVDDARAFVRELTVPNAKKIGRYIGEKQAGEIGAEIFGNIAARRQNRQLGRRVPPRNVADPAEAARRGEALGALIGGAIGESTGEKEALKEFDFDGYKMFVSDLETYVRQSAIMRAEQEGKIPPKPLRLNGDRVLLGMAGNLISGIEDGSLEDSLRDSAFQDERFADPTPLFARRTSTVLLDDKHLLVGLGNEKFLRTALTNWRAAIAAEKANAAAPKGAPTREPQYITNVPDVDFGVNWRNLGAQIPATDEFNVLGAVRFSPVDAQIMGAWLRQNYFPNLPDFAPKTLPKETPQTLWTSSVSSNREFVRGVVPNRTIANVVSTFAGGATPFELLLKPKTGTSETAPDDGFDVDFDDALN